MYSFFNKNENISDYRENKFFKFILIIRFFISNPITIKSNLNIIYIFMSLLSVKEVYNIKKIINKAKKLYSNQVTFKSKSNMNLLVFKLFKVSNPSNLVALRDVNVNNLIFVFNNYKSNIYIINLNILYNK